MTMNAPFAPALATPVLPDERYHVKALLDRADAEKRIASALRDGAFRPPDAATGASVGDLYALFVPFWRVDMQRTDASIRLSQVRVGTIGVPIPRTSTTDARATWMVCARSSFPYALKRPGPHPFDDAKPLESLLTELTAGDPDVAGGWEALDADVSQSHARTVGATSLARSSSAHHEIATSTELTVHAIHFVRYPIWFARYQYAGAASPGGDRFYVGVSAVDGACITARHPSKLRSAAAKVKGLFGTLADRVRGVADGGAESPDAGGADLDARFKAHVKQRKPR